MRQKKNHETARYPCNKKGDKTFQACTGTKICSSLHCKPVSVVFIRYTVEFKSYCKRVIKNKNKMLQNARLKAPICCQKELEKSQGRYCNAKMQVANNQIE